MTQNENNRIDKQNVGMLIMTNTKSFQQKCFIEEKTLCGR